ncbi:MAG TPA: hypothetical protein VLL76_09330, partial [Candidatus Omnitrophota bacterium]|nr:hypothetical protein [Candidatus Omnitrophota bacterium]
HHRNLVPLEMLAPLVIVAAMGALPLPRAARRGLATAVVAFVTASGTPAIGPRAPWGSVALVPPVENGTMVLLTGSEPVSFLIPAFPADTRFVRVEPQFGERFAKLSADLLAAHPGPVLALFGAVEHQAASAAVAVHGLALGDCRTVSSPLAANAFSLCAAARPRPAAPVEEPGPPPAAEASPSAAGTSDGSAGSPAPR